MVYTNEKNIYNSTFDEHQSNSLQSKILWKKTPEGSSMSSIEEYFDPKEIKRVVDSLVLSKFGFQYNQKIAKLNARFARSDTSYSVSLDDLELTPRSSNFSLNHEQLSIPYQRPETEDQVMDYFDTFLGLTNLEESTKPEDTLSDSNELTNCECFVDNELQNLRQTKQQILKAICYHKSRSSNKLCKARLEAEKLLLVTQIQMELLQKNNFDETFNKFCSGCLTISGIHLWPEDCYCSENYFLCLIIHQSQVYATEVSKIKSSGILRFNKNFVFSYVQPNSKFRIRIYSVSSAIFKNSVTSHVFCHNGTPDPVYDENSYNSVFTLCGETDLSPIDFAHREKLRIQTKFGLLSARVATKANININAFGFLNVSQKVGRYPIWNRQWCNLNGKFLKFYNYPAQEMYGVSAASVIKLTPSSDLRVLSREECSRKRTLLLCANGRDFLLSCESQEEFEVWKEYLCAAVKHVKMWERD